MRVQDAVRLARERRSDRVRHRDQVRPLASRVPGRLERVDRLARLAHCQRQGVGAEHRIAVAELARDLDLDGQARPVFDRVLRHEPGVERRPARDHEDLVDLAQDVVRDPQLVHRQAAVHHSPDERVTDGARLLVDLLQHEVFEPALLGARHVVFHDDRLGVQRVPLEVGEDHPLAPGLNDLPLLDRDHGGRAIEHGGDVGREQRLAVTQSHDERRRDPHPNDEAGLVRRDHDESVGALQLAHGPRGPHRPAPHRR